MTTTNARVKCEGIKGSRSYLTDTDVVAPRALHDRSIIIDIQDVDGEWVVCEPGRWTIICGTNLQQHMNTERRKLYLFSQLSLHYL